MSLDVFQQVFTLSLASNLVRKTKGTPKSLREELSHRLTYILPMIGSGWDVVWGPVVWKHDPENVDTGPDNSWYIAFHPGLRFEDGCEYPTYVISIAGTPDDAPYVWKEQNFAIGTVADFEAWVADGIENPPVEVLPKDVAEGKAYIATGTANAVHLLLTTTAPGAAGFSGTTLLDFVTHVDKSRSPRFITTGHSLGGALSPSLALALTLSGIIPRGNIFTYPTAGPSPGNINFTDLFVQTLPSRKLAGAASHQGWNLNLVNTLDVPPQVWASDQFVSPKQNLLNIPCIYGEPALREVKNTVLLAVIRSRASGVLYKPLPSQYFTGPSPPAAPTSLAEFLKISGHQHVQAYLDEVGVIDPLSGLSQMFSAEPAEDDKRFEFLALFFDWMREHSNEVREVVDRLDNSAELNVFLAEIGKNENVAQILSMYWTS